MSLNIRSTLTFAFIIHIQLSCCLIYSINILRYLLECMAVIGSHALRRTLKRSPEIEFNLLFTILFY